MFKTDRNIYIGNSDSEIALKDFMSKLNLKFRKETIKVRDSLGRISYSSIYSRKSSPAYHASAMDGIAVNHKDTKGATEVNPISLKLNIDFEYVNTGNPINHKFDSVIMIEDVIGVDEETISIISPSKPFDNIRPVGEDIVANEMIVPSYKNITPFDMASMIQGGVEEIEVIKKPIISIIPTGKEIISNTHEIGKGKIMDSNSVLFSGLISQLGGIPCVKDIVRDDFEELKISILKSAFESDIVIVNAGSSTGTEDYTLKAIQSVGEVCCHGVALKPGKPTILGIVNKKPVVGIPGYPVSAFVAFDEFIKPLIKELLNTQVKEIKCIDGILSKRITSSLKHKEIVRVQLGKVYGKTIVSPLQRGAGITMSLVKADGIIEIPRNVEGIEKGKIVNVRLLKNMDDIEKRIVSIGSHDLIMDIIADMIPLSSNNTGSLGGILSIKNNECHLAPVHLLDEETGIYNESFLKKYLGDDWILLKSIKRLQGLIVKKGNPKNIKEMKDLAKEEVRFVNRQRGAGTRVLLDYKLKNLSLNPKNIYGYDRELMTHMAVASEVLEDGADVTIGVYSAAKALDLDFIEIGYEEYDFALRKDFLKDYRFQNLMTTIGSKEFKTKLVKLGGYLIEVPQILRPGDK